MAGARKVHWTGKPWANLMCALSSTSPKPGPVCGKWPTIVGRRQVSFERELGPGGRQVSRRPPAALADRSRAQTRLRADSERPGGNARRALVVAVKRKERRQVR